MKILRFGSISAVLGLVLTGGLALAQGLGSTSEQPSSGGGQQQVQQAPNSAVAQSTARKGGCEMMNKMASLQERVTQLEKHVSPSTNPL